MGLLSDFNASLPLSPKSLIQWLKNIFTELDKCKVITLDFNFLTMIYAADVDTDLSAYVSNDEFDKFYSHIQGGGTIRFIQGGVFIQPVGAWCGEGDERYIGICVIDTFYNVSGDDTIRSMTITVSKGSDGVYLSDKTIKKLSDESDASGGNEEYVFDGALYNTLYDTSPWTEISDILGHDKFMELYNAIHDNRSIRVCSPQIGTTAAFSLVPVYTWATKATNTDYYRIRMDFFDPSHVTTQDIQRVRMGMEYDMTTGEMYLSYISNHTVDLTA